VERSTRQKFLGRVLGGSPGKVAVGLLMAAAVALVIAAVAGELALAEMLALEGIVLALLFGVTAVRDALVHERALNEVVTRASEHAESLKGVTERVGIVATSLDRVSRAVLTRQIDSPFPDFLPLITDLVGSARTSLRVLCDNPAYAVVSGGDSFDEYLAALTTKTADLADGPPKKVGKLMFLDTEERRQLHRHQVCPRDHKSDWEKWRDENVIKLAEFWKRSSKLCDAAEVVPPATLSLDDYVDRLVKTNAAVLERHLRKASLKLMRFRDGVIKAGPSLYFWLRDEFNDDRQAIFVIVPLGRVEEHNRERAFHTQDPGLIDALVGVFERYERATDP
jgi:hypothetical protein